MKVLMLGWEFPPIINGGLGIACLGIAKALRQKAQLTIILPKSDPNYVVDNVNLIGLNNVEVTDIIRNETWEHYKEFHKVEYIESKLMPYDEEELEVKSELRPEEGYRATTHFDQNYLGRFEIGELYGEDVNQKVVEFSKFAAALAAQMDFDIVYGHDWMSILAGVEIKKRTGKPFALHVHALAYDRGGPDSRGFIYDLEKYGMEQADLVLPVSHYTGTVVRDHYGIDQGKIYPVHNGVEAVMPYRLQKSFPESLVLFLGRITGQKGPEIFLEIAEKVIERHSNVRFVMAGTGDRMKRIIESGAYKKVGHKFHFTGFLNKEKVNKLLSMADIYCMPSVSEPFGLSALEAAQFGIPCIISKQSGAAEVMHHALKADFWDVNLMSEHIIELLENKKLRKKVIEESYKDLKRLTWDDSVEEIYKAFKIVINE